MTLILTLAAPGAIHQSSDYRLTRLTPAPIPSPDDAAGAKQLLISSKGLTGYVSFTGVAEVGGLKTREWISEIISGATQPIDIDLVASVLAARASGAVKNLPSRLKMLSIIMAITEIGRNPRIVMISNTDRFGASRRKIPLDWFVISTWVPKRPVLYSFGCDGAISRADRHCLLNAIRRGSNAGTIRKILAQVNARVARSYFKTRCNALISR